MNPIAQDEIEQIMREAMINAMRHANARNIELEVHYGLAALSVSLEDDGNGISPEILDHGRSGHWGLSGMRERASCIGATLVITSRATEPNKGTRVDLRLKSRLAYTSRLARWWQGRR